MMKVLLVDDELLARHHIRNLINWEDEGFYLCGEAETGREALSLMKGLNPDIVITDVSMPEMNGVDLSKHLKNSYPDTKLLVLSSYDDYEYVRETLKNGAYDYLLKHRLEKNSFLELLNKMKWDISEVQHTEQRTEYLTRSTIHLRLFRNYIKDWFTDNVMHNDNNMLASIRQQIGSQPMIVAAIQIKHFHSLIRDLSEEEQRNLILSIYDLCGNDPKDNQDDMTVYLDDGRFAHVFMFNEQRSENDINQQCLERLHRLKSRLHMYLDLNLSVGKSHVVYDIKHLRKAYAAACHLLEVNHDSVQNLHAIIYMELNEIESALKHSDLIKLHYYLNKIFRELKQQKSSNSSIHMTINALIQIAQRVKEQHGENDFKHFDFMPFNHDQFSHDRLVEIYILISNLFLQVQDDLYKNNYRPYVKEAISYILQHYDEYISLDVVAEQSSISASYLSRLFKEDTGQSFVEYLNYVRARMAGYYMVIESQKIKEVYLKVGFNSYNYFFKVFKQVMGMTPQEYWKRYH